MAASPALMPASDVGLRPSRRPGRRWRLVTAATVAVAVLLGSAPAVAQGDPPPGTSAEARTEACIARLPLRQQLGQLLMVLAAPDLFAKVAFLFAGGDLGGVVVMEEPSPDDRPTLEAMVRVAQPVPPLVAVDEEGGELQVLGGALGTLPSPRSQVAANDPAGVEQLARLHGEGMAALGYTVDLAPVLDVSGGSRSFSSDPVTAAGYGLAFASGLAQAGLLPVVKHFPGLGTASGDPHEQLPVTSPIDQLLTRDIVPFEMAADRDDIAVMVAHVVVPGLTGDMPASLSPAAIDLLRDRIGFDGIVMTDSLTMGAIQDQWRPDRAAELAILAGNDIAMVAGLQYTQRTLDRLEWAILGGRLSHEQVLDSVRRVFAAKGVDPCSLEL